MKRVLQFTCILSCLYFNSHAQSIAIANNSFEDQTFADNGFSTGSITSWTKSGATIGTFNPGGSFYTAGASDGVIPGIDGVNAAFFTGTSVSSLSQTLSENIVVDTQYTLTVAVGDRDAGGALSFAGYDIRLFAGGVEVASVNSTTSLGDGVFTDVTLVYTAQAGDSGALGVQIGSSSPASGHSADFDNVRLVKSTSIAIANNSFEDQTFADNGFSTGAITSWTKSGSTIGAFNPGGSFYTAGAGEGVIPGIDGVNAAFFTGTSVSSLSQTLSENIVVDTQYTLTVAVGDRDAGGALSFAGYDIRLFAGGVEVASVNSTTSLGDGVFTDVTLVYTAQAGDSGALGVQIGSSSPASGHSADFDNVRLVKGGDTNPVNNDGLITISSPLDREVRQRSISDQSTVNFTGSYTGNASEIEIQVTDLNGGSNSIAWTTLDDVIESETYSGDLILNTGWYQIDIRSTGTGSLASETETIPFFGVGDVYIAAGQSNAANWGESKQTSNSNQVSYFNTNNLADWTHAADVPGTSSSAIGSRGAPWPILGDLLVNENSNIPVAFASIGRGGSSVCEWEPTTTSACVKDSDNYPNLKELLEYFGVNGFKAVLWHQGEKDRDNTKANYVTSLTNIINTSRVDAGWDVPWYVAIASYATFVRTQIAEAQVEVIDNINNVFLGANTDELIGNDADTGLPWRFDGVHFSTDGLAAHANLWLNTLQLSQENFLSTSEIDSSNFNVYRNSNGYLVINTNIQLDTLSLYDMKGLFLKETNASEMDVSSISTGVYFLHVKTEKGLLRKKIVIIN